MCRGIAAIDVYWTAEPDSSSVDFAAKPLSESLDLGSFFEAERTIEWRGPMVEGKLRPVAAIVRYRIGRSVGSHDQSRLVVYRVGGETSCIIGKVATNEDARVLVDRRASTFVCGKREKHGP